MKKSILLMLTLFFTVFFSLSTYAGSLTAEAVPPSGAVLNEKTGPEQSEEPEELTGFELTGGLEKEHESTFDQFRTVAGTGEEDTEVVIDVYISEDGELTKVTGYEFTVGASGMFSQRVNLELGENVIVITAAKDGLEKKTKFTVNRKKLEIKLELEQPGILLPGQKPAS